MIDDARQKFRLCEAWGNVASTDPNAILKFNYLPITQPTDHLPEDFPSDTQF